jgi:hypothetical protein
MKTLANQALHIAIVVISVLVLTSTVAILFTNSTQFKGFASFIFFIFMAGTVGGVANNYRRLQQLPLDTTEELPPAIHRLLTVQIYLSPIVGGVFASVLYLIFMSGILQGDFFPAFQSESAPFIDTPTFADVTLPKTNRDAAKALIWAFIAGFAEGFVPNFIDKIAKEQRRDKPGTAEA